MTAQTWLDRHNAAYQAPLDPHEKVLVGIMRSIDLLVLNSVTEDRLSEAIRPYIIRILSGFLGLLRGNTGRLDKGMLNDWARSRAGLVGLSEQDDFGSDGLEFEIDLTD